MALGLPEIDTGFGIFDKVLNTAVGVRQVENFFEASKQQDETFRTVEREQGPAIEAEPVDPLVVEMDSQRDPGVVDGLAVFLRDNGLLLVGGAAVAGVLLFLIATRD